MQCVAVSTHNPPGTSGGGGGGTSDAGGGGSDRTAVTYEVDDVNGGFRVQTETVDGVTWTLSYGAQGELITRAWVAGGLSATIDYDSEGFGYGDDTTNIFQKGGAIRVFAAQMAALKAALITLGTEVTALWYVADFQSDRGLLLEWNHVDEAFRGPGGSPIVFHTQRSLTSIVAPGTTETTAYTAPDFPGWLRGPKGVWETELWCNYPGEVGNKTTRWKVDGTTFLTQITTAVTANAINHRAELWALDADTFQGFTASGSVANGFGVTNTTAMAASFDITVDTDLTFTATCQYSDAGDGANTITVQVANIFYTHP